MPPHDKIVVLLVSSVNCIGETVLAIEIEKTKRRSPDDAVHKMF